MKKDYSDITWQTRDNRSYAYLDNKIVCSILHPGKGSNCFWISDLHDRKVRLKFRTHAKLDDAKNAVLNVYLGIEEPPNDTVVSGHKKCWVNNSMIVSEKELNEVRINFKANGNCHTRFNALILNGSDIAGRTEAAVYLTSDKLTKLGIVFRFDYNSDSIGSINIDECPQGLAFTEPKIIQRSRRPSK